MSLVRLGEKPAGRATPASLILECHQRIRWFAGLAVRLASEDAPDAELAEAAGRVHRYFTVALPLHVADEEQSVMPRLLAYAPATAEALANMEREHQAHQERLVRLIPAWAALGFDRRGRRDTLAGAAQLRAELETHLTGEERAIVPALARLPVTESDALLEEFQARRR
jgi:iron-sulfur cluster repair protein YtfE (RIC family)